MHSNVQTSNCNELTVMMNDSVMSLMFCFNPSSDFVGVIFLNTNVTVSSHFCPQLDTGLSCHPFKSSIGLTTYHEIVGLIHGTSTILKMN